MILILVVGFFLHFCLLQNTFLVSVYYIRDALLLAVVAEAQPLVILARQPDGAIIHFPVIHSVNL